MSADAQAKKETIYAPFRPDEEGPYIFISYSHKDRDRVFPLITRIYEKGWHVWYDEGLEITENYYTSLSRHIKNCAVFLLFVTHNSVKAEFVCEHELLLATTSRKRIAICYLDKDAEFEGEAKDAIDIATVSRKNPKTDEAGLIAALEGIEGLTRFEERRAEGFKILANVGDVIDAAEENDDYEYEKCEGGVRLIKYKGSEQNDIEIPREYKGQPVKEICGKYGEYVFKVYAETKYDEDGGIILTKYTGAEKEVRIPAEHAGHPVVGLDRTFRKRDDIVSVIIPNGVREIGEQAFFYCENLVSVTIPASVTAIREQAFRGCSKLRSVTLPEGLKVIEESAFRRCSSLSSVNIPVSLTELDRVR